MAKQEVLGERWSARRVGFETLSEPVQGPLMERFTGLGYDQIHIEALPVLFQDENNTLWQAENERVLVSRPWGRHSEPEVFGVVGGRYEVIQHRDVAQAIDTLSEKWNPSHIGVLEKGKTFFTVLDAGESSVKGDGIRNHFIAQNRTDGGSGLKFGFISVRLRCSNQLPGLFRSVSGILSHTRRILDDFQYRMKLMSALQNEQNLTLGLFERLANTIVNDDMISQVLAAAFPYPNKPAITEAAENLITVKEESAVLDSLLIDAANAEASWEARKERIDDFRDAAQECFAVVGGEHPPVRDTAWALWNGVVEVADHREGTGEVEASSLWGQRYREKQRAIKTLVSLL